ncbi:MAG: potassium transporter TrkG, partial [Dehalococcoidia bacterium]
MSRAGTKRPRGPGVVRRGVRKPTIFELPPQPKPPTPPHPGRHAQRFALGLALIVAGGTALLASPWTTESGESTPVIDALFTAVSAVTVTGLVTVDTESHWNLFGEAVILALIQIGGLGFMVGASIILLFLRRGSTRLSDLLLVKEGAPTVSLGEAVQLSRQIVIFTFSVEAVGAILLTLRVWRDMPLPEALWTGIF